MCMVDCKTTAHGWARIPTLTAAFLQPPLAQHRLWRWLLVIRRSGQWRPNLQRISRAGACYAFAGRQRTGEIKEIYPLGKTGDPDFRCNWNTPIHVGASSKALYIGCQFLFRSKDHGDSWEKISPDLTSNNPQWLEQSESGGLTLDNSDAEKYKPSTPSRSLRRECADRLGWDG